MIRSAQAQDWPHLVTVWREAVLATHHFLAPQDVAAIESELVPHYFPAVYLVVAEEADTVIGFAGTLDGGLEMLFVDPAHHRRGVGSALLAHVVTHEGVRRVDVNEQNPSATAFYLRHGFEIVGRSATDDAGRPFPLLHLARTESEARPHAVRGE